MKRTAAFFGKFEFLVKLAKECPPNAANVLKNRLIDALDKTPSKRIVFKDIVSKK